MALDVLLPRAASRALSSTLWVRGLAVLSQMSVIGEELDGDVFLGPVTVQHTPGLVRLKVITRTRDCKSTDNSLRMQIVGVD